MWNFSTLLYLYNSARNSGRPMAIYRAFKLNDQPNVQLIIHVYNICSVSPTGNHIIHLWVYLYLSGGWAGGHHVSFMPPPPLINNGQTATVTIYDPLELGGYSRSASVDNFTTSLWKCAQSNNRWIIRPKPSNTSNKGAVKIPCCLIMLNIDN